VSADVSGYGGCGGEGWTGSTKITDINTYLTT